MRIQFKYLLAASVVAFGLASAGSATAGSSCTDGVDCYCDRVTNPSDPLYDPVAIMCEDFEAPQLWDEQNASQYEGGGAPNFGPWYDGFSYRGDNSYWVKKLGQSVSSCAFSNSDPAPSDGGMSCNHSTCGTAGADGSGNVYNVRNAAECIVVYEDGEAGVVGGHSPSGDVFDGTAYLGMKNKPGTDAGFLFARGLSPPATEVGITEALALSPGFHDSGVLGQALKRDEWGGPNGFAQFWYIGGQSNVPNYPQRFPFAAFLWTQGGGSCWNNIGNVQVHAGEVMCNGDQSTNNALVYSPGPNWNRAQAMPNGQWHCVQAHIRGLGTSNVRVTVSLNGQPVVDLSGINGPAMLHDQSWTDWGFNTYSNHYGGGGSGQEVVHYRDNYHARRGPPVSCSQIGYTGATGTPPPPPPPPTATPPAPPVLLPPQ